MTKAKEALDAVMENIREQNKSEIEKQISDAVIYGTSFIKPDHDFNFYNVSLSDILLFDTNYDNQHTENWE